MGKWPMAVISILLLVVLAISVSAQVMGLRRHRRMYPVPAPGPVVIDGKLDDWDLSGQMEVYVMQDARRAEREDRHDV